MSSVPRDLPDLGVGVWWSALRGGAAPSATYDARTELAQAMAHWRALAPGERITLYGAGLSAQSPSSWLANGPSGPATGSGNDRDEVSVEGAGRTACHVERFGVFPGTGGGSVLLPLDDAKAFRSGLALLPAGRARWRLARVGLAALSAVPRARGAGRPELWVLSHDSARDLKRRTSAVQPIAATLDRSIDRTSSPMPDSANAPPSLPLFRGDRSSFAVASGVPGGRQKLVVRHCDPHGAPWAYTKLAWRPRSAALVVHEARALQHVARVAPGAAPALLAAGGTEAHPWILVEALEGPRPAPKFTAAHAAYLARLQRAGAAKVPAQACHEATQRAALESLAPRLAPALRADLYALAELLRHAPQLPPALVHGDFTPWNLAGSPRGLRAYDWEFAQEAGPALFDLLHHELQAGILLARADAPRLLARLHTTLAGPARPLLDPLGLAPNSVGGPVVRAALGRYLLQVILRDEAEWQAEPPPYPQVAWQRSARAALVRHVLAAEQRRLDPWGPDSREAAA
jgi:hypothetical protein